MARSFSSGPEAARVLAAARAFAPIVRIVAAISATSSSRIAFFSDAPISATFWS
jgi:hypothetical protein